MTSQIKTVQLRILTAAEGMVLTNGSDFSCVSGSVYLGVNDSPDNWYEVTEERAEELKEKLKEMQENQ